MLRNCISVHPVKNWTTHPKTFAHTLVDFTNPGKHREERMHLTWSTWKNLEGQTLPICIKCNASISQSTSKAKQQKTKIVSHQLSHQLTENLRDKQAEQYAQASKKHLYGKITQILWNLEKSIKILWNTIKIIWNSFQHWPQNTKNTQKSNQKAPK